MSCVRCGQPHVCTTEEGPLCNACLKTPAPPTPIERIEQRLDQMADRLKIIEGGGTA